MYAKPHEISEMGVIMYCAALKLILKYTFLELSYLSTSPICWPKFPLALKWQNLNKSRRQHEFGDGQLEMHTGPPSSPSEDEDVILSSLRSASANGQSISLSVSPLNAPRHALGAAPFSQPSPLSPHPS